MGRKSSIDGLPVAIKDKLGKLIKENRLTLDQIVAELQSVAGENAPSRTAVWRHKDKIEKVMSRVRERREIAVVFAREIGAAPESDQGQMLVEILQTLLTDTALAASDRGEPLEPKTLKELAQAIKAATESSKLTLQQQDLIERRAREKLVREQQEKLDGMKKDGSITFETLRTIRQRVYGITETDARHSR